jgi:hypothetical protein
VNLKSLAALIILAVIVLFIGGAFISLEGSSKPGVASSNPIVGTKPLVEVNDILADPIVYDSVNVEIESQVIEWVTKKSFNVETVGGAFGGGGKPLLVIRQYDFTLPQDNSSNKLGLGEKVRVHLKGKVVVVNKDQLEKYLNVNLDSDEFKLDGNNLNDWTLGPVLLLDTAEKI